MPRPGTYSRPTYVRTIMQTVGVYAIDLWTPRVQTATDSLHLRRPVVNHFGRELDRHIRRHARLRRSESLKSQAKWGQKFRLCPFRSRSFRLASIGLRGNPDTKPNLRSRRNLCHRFSHHVAEDFRMCQLVTGTQEPDRIRDYAGFRLVRLKLDITCRDHPVGSDDDGAIASNGRNANGQLLSS